MGIYILIHFVANCSKLRQISGVKKGVIFRCHFLLPLKTAFKNTLILAVISALVAGFSAILGKLEHFKHSKCSTLCGSFELDKEEEEECNPTHSIEFELKEEEPEKK